MNLVLVRTIGRWMAIVAILWVLSKLLPALFPPGPPPVQMPGGPRVTLGVTPELDSIILNAAPADRVHFVVQFTRDLTGDEIDDLDVRLSIDLDGPVPEHAYITSVVRDDWDSVSASLLANSPPAVRLIDFRPRDRTAPELQDPNDPDLLALPPYAMTGNVAVVYVRFFDDVPIARQAEILTERNAEQPDAPVLTIGPTGIWAVHMPGPDLELLAVDYDEVRFIEPTMPPIIPDMDHARGNVGGDSLGTDGAGTVIAQWEGCQASVTNADMSNRLLLAGNVSFLCRHWQFADTSGDGNYQMGEPIGVDIDEDGTIDTMLDGAMPQNVEWEALPVYYKRPAAPNETFRYYVDDAGDPEQIEVDDIELELDVDEAEVTPVRVTVAGNQTLEEFAPERHPTLVAGMMISNSLSQTTGDEPIYEGMVPEASIRSHAWRHTTVVFDYWDAIQAGARISSHSFGWPRDYHFVAGADPYWGFSEFYDAVVSGRRQDGSPLGLPDRMLLVGSSGNEGRRSVFWRTARIVNSAKNVIAVGNVSSSHDDTHPIGLGAPARNSGRGPTVDGRLTPILSAPGTQLKCEPDGNDWDCDHAVDFGIKSTMPGGSYASARGTSFSTPIVSGAAAQLSEAYSSICLSEPAPQDLRALLVHSARDLTQAWNLPGLSSPLELVGPDFIFGYGLVRVDDAGKLVQNIVNDELETGWMEHRITIDSMSQVEAGPNGPQLRVTLVWDDPPYYAEYPPRQDTGILQNDLDLEIIDPDGHRHLPWVLDASPGNEADPAKHVTRPPFMYVLQEWRDHRNTIEQVVVDFDTAWLNEEWTIRVRGYQMRRGPQDYTLVSRAFVPGANCGDFANGFTVWIPNPVDVPDTLLAWVLFWLGVIILVWLVFETIVWLYATVSNKYGGAWPYLAVVLLLILLFVIFRLLVAQSFLMLAYLVLIGLAYVLWRVLWP